MYLSLYCKSSKRVTQRFYGERELETEHNCNILTPTLMAVSFVSFSFSRAAQPATQRPTLLAFSTTSYQQLLLTSTQSGAPKAPLAWCGFLYHITTLTPTVWLPALTELYNSSTPTQSLEWHVWLSSSRNNCHAVQRSLSSGASVYECIMGFFPCPILLARPTYAIFPHKCHRNVSLPSSASLWNGQFGRVEGQNTTLLHQPTGL